MKSLRSAVIRMVAPVLPFVARLSAERRGLVLVYHALDERQGDPRRELVPAHSTEQFASHLRHLQARYRVVAASELPAAVGSRRRGRRIPVAITFDDDLASHVLVAAPLLQRHGLPATFFLTGAALDRPHAFWWERFQAAVDRGLDLGSETIHQRAATIEALSPNERESLVHGLPDDVPGASLDRDGVRVLRDAGCEIGFHTLRHDRLPDLGDEALARALREGRDELEQACGCSVATIAYPHGKADERVARAAQRAGFALGFTGRYEPVRDRSDPHLLGRIEPVFATGAPFAVQIARALGRPAQR